jgi:hypothetical protein
LGKIAAPLLPQPSPQPVPEAPEVVAVQTEVAAQAMMTLAWPISWISSTFAATETLSLSTTDTSLSSIVSQ